MCAAWDEHLVLKECHEASCYRQWAKQCNNRGGFTAFHVGSVSLALVAGDALDHESLLASFLPPGLLLCGFRLNADAWPHLEAADKGDKLAADVGEEFSEALCAGAMSEVTPGPALSKEKLVSL